MDIRKIICGALAAAMLCSFAACGDEEDDDDTSKSKKRSGSSVSDSRDDDEDDNNSGNAGYVAKSKQASADASASSISKAGSSAMMDVENRNDENVSGTYWLTGAYIGAKGEALDYGSEMKINDLDEFGRWVKNYFSDIDKCEEAGCYFVDGTCVGAYVQLESGYFGTYPAGLIDASENKSKEIDVDECVRRIEKYVSEKY